MLVLPMLPRQRSFRGDATSLLECRVVVPGHDGASVFARARSPCRWRRARSALLDAFGLEPSAEGRRALAASLRAAADVVDGDAASPSSEPAPPPRVDDGADAGSSAPARARRAARRARVPLRVRRAPRDVRRVGLPRLRAAGLGRRAHGGGRALSALRLRGSSRPTRLPRTSRTRGAGARTPASARWGRSSRCGSARSGERKGGNEGRKRTKVLIRGRDATSTSTKTKKKTTAPLALRAATAARRVSIRHILPPGACFSRSTRRMSWTTALY